MSALGAIGEREAETVDAAVENRAGAGSSSEAAVLAVHRALWRLADGGEVCATIRQIADTSAVAEHIVRRSLSELVEAGQIVPAGKRWKTSVFRLSSSGPTAETPSRRDSPQGGSSSSTQRSTADSRRSRGISPREPEDKAWFERDWSEMPEWLEECKKYARLIEAHLWGDGELGQLEDAGEGVCDDCGRFSSRVRFGRVALCREDAALRLKVRARLAKTDGLMPVRGFQLLAATERRVRELANREARRKAIRAQIADLRHQLEPAA